MNELKKKNPPWNIVLYFIKNVANFRFRIGQHSLKINFRSPACLVFKWLVSFIGRRRRRRETSLLWSQTGLFLFFCFLHFRKWYVRWTANTEHIWKSNFLQSQWRKCGVRGESIEQLFSQTWVRSLEFFHFSASVLKEDRCKQHVQLTSIPLKKKRNLTSTQMVLASVVLSKHTGNMKPQLRRSGANSEKCISRCSLIHIIFKIKRWLLLHVWNFIFFLVDDAGIYFCCLTTNFHMN